MQDFAGTTGGAIHIAALTETWQHAGLDLPDLPGMQRSFAAPRQAGERARGGVAAYLADSLHCRVAVWRRRAADGVLWLRLRGVRGLASDLLLEICYLPPQGSGGCPGDITQWWAALEDDCAQAEATGLVLVTGDFNARTATQPDWPHGAAMRPRRSEDQVFDCRGGAAVGTVQKYRAAHLQWQGGRGSAWQHYQPGHLWGRAGCGGLRACMPPPLSSGAAPFCLAGPLCRSGSLRPAHRYLTPSPPRGRRALPLWLGKRCSRVMHWHA